MKLACSENRGSCLRSATQPKPNMVKVLTYPGWVQAIFARFEPLIFIPSSNSKCYNYTFLFTIKSTTIHCAHSDHFVLVLLHLKHTHHSEAFHRPSSPDQQIPHLYGVKMGMTSFWVHLKSGGPNIDISWANMTMMSISHIGFQRL